MSPNDPTPEPASEEPATDGDAPEVVDDGTADVPTTGVGERLPPGPDDVPISHLPPPSGSEPAAAEAPVHDPDVVAPPDEVEEPAAGEPAADTDPDGDTHAYVIEQAVEPAVADDAIAEPVGDGEVTAEEAEVLPPDEAADREDGASDADWPAVVDPEPAVGPATAAHPHRIRSRLTVLAVVVAVVASLLALTKAQRVGDLTAQRDDRLEIEQVSARFGAAYLSFDFAHAEASGTAVRRLATPKFAASYTAQSAPGIEQLFTSRQTTTKATTTAVYLGPVTSQSARALVVVDVTATSPSDGAQRLDDVSFVLDLDHTSAGWRVDKVVRAPQPSLDDSPPK